MSLLFRCLWVLIFGGRRQEPLEPSVLRFRTWPHDLDLNLHMNNGRYFTIMDLGRLHLLRRAHAFILLLRKGWRPLVGSEAIRFRRALAPFQTFELRTRILAWDDRWLYLEQRFVSKGETAALGLVKAQIRGSDGPVDPVELMRLLGHDVPSPPMPNLPARWENVDEVMRELERA